MNRKHFSRGVPSKIIPGIIVLVLFALASGCAVGPEGDYKYGKATRDMLAAQVINWAAPNDPTPVDGMPGAISEEIYNKRYVRELTLKKANQKKADVTGEFFFSQ